MIGYVLISLDRPVEQEVFNALNKLDRVKEARILFGEWDLIAKVEADNPDDLGAYIIDNIRSIEGIKLTSTLISAN